MTGISTFELTIEYTFKEWFYKVCRICFFGGGIVTLVTFVTWVYIFEPLKSIPNLYPIFLCAVLSILGGSFWAVAMSLIFSVFSYGIFKLVNRRSPLIFTIDYRGLTVSRSSYMKNYCWSSIKKIRVKDGSISFLSGLHSFDIPKRALKEDYDNFLKAIEVFHGGK